ncbi:hypothetical protein AAG906_014437 [Vitis piasezkii]
MGGNKKAADEDQFIQSKGHCSNVAFMGQIHEMHDTKVGVIRASTTFKKLGQQFYWHGMHRSVQDYVKGCAVARK